jgi:AcrR family transcriptional regulator
MPVAPAVLEERRARRRERVVRRLVVVVERLLEEEDSYLDLTVDRILEEGEMARSTFYSYFDDKADLIVALGETAMSEIIDGAQAIWELPPGSSRDEVAGAVRHTIQTYLPHTRLMNALVEAATYDVRVRERFDAAYADAQGAAARHIRAGQKAGFVREDLHPAETAGWLTWMAERGMTQLVQHASKAQLARLQDAFTAILWHTLYER